MLMGALAGVLYIMQALKSPTIQTQAGDPNSFVGLLTGGDQRLFNWCPLETEKVQIFQWDTGEVRKILTTPQDLSAACEIMISGFSQGVHAPRFKILMTAFPKNSGNPVSLEKAEGVPLFQVGGMPFSSPGLVKVIERFGVQ